MAELGRAALVVCLGLSAYALLAGGWAIAAHRRRLAVSAQNALVAAFGSALVAGIVLVVALVRHDFSIVYVQRLTSRELPLGYTLSAFWGGQEGSLLLWLLVLTGYSTAVVYTSRRRNADLLPWIVPPLALVATFFAFLLVAIASPFETQVAPANGVGLNPSLQNPYMVAHPPLLYLGYVGLTVPWAFAMGALLSRRTDEAWIISTRRWTLVAWTALGVGQLLGAKWAYEEIGWGGYYAWDPVENAALMPWLAATAFLHSVMIQEKRGMLKVWNVLLVILAFGLSLFGTFLTRSGILDSIHSFTESSIGPWFLGFIALVLALSLGLLFLRLPLLRSRTRLESLVSREATFLYNNLLLVALCLTILWGVVWPLLSEAVRGEASVVAGPYYNFFLRVFGLPLLLLMGLAPLVAWRRASLRSLGGSFAWPAGIAAATAIVLLLLGAGSSPAGLLAYTFSAFVLGSIGYEFVRGTRARRAVDGGGWFGAFSSLVGRNRRRYGGYIVHAAVVLLAVGIAGSAYDSVKDQRMTRGERMSIGDYTLTYEGTTQREAANARELRAQVAVERNGESLGIVEPGKNFYPVEQQVSSEPAIRHDAMSLGDLFVILETANGDGSVQLKALVNPLVNLIWLAGLVFLAGSLIALWPDPAEERRLLERYALAPA
ncbi:MAG TPA: cytochrome c-type biogenesis CcmF C-terminal domain-containing protein [Gaiellaceae bacterium]|nr:cytochrome c-type biogenesis CcmF C-terminal domain-containing protein [Gaiellaceae bacterium]